ncbi:MAG: PfaD family polyunsaturated fatty acid/polyketide biosynthesis protein [Burkholderia sp.]
MHAFVNDEAPGPSAGRLGSAAFRERHHLRYAYAAGGMYRGTASAALVARMSRAGLLSFLGTGGLDLDEIDAALGTLRANTASDAIYGANLLAHPTEPATERALIALYLHHGVRRIEAAVFTRISAALVLFRALGLRRDAAGRIHCAHRILAKVSRLEVAEAFLHPAPADLLETLLDERAIDAEQAALAREVPMCDDLCVEADSGGHTDGGIPSILLPAMLRLRDRLAARFAYREPLCVGLAGGIGTPEAVAGAFAMGADFVMTGSINQCTVESGATDVVKTMLQDAGIHDMAYAPAGDTFEIGGRVQVLKKSVLFPMRANKLHALYQHYPSLDALPPELRAQLERSYFRQDLGAIWEAALRHLEKRGNHEEIRLARANPKVRMARVFKWYFHYSTQLAFSGAPDDQVNYQVHTGPALGAFNAWVAGSALESWRCRHVDEIGCALMEGAARQLGAGSPRFAGASDG